MDCIIKSVKTVFEISTNLLEMRLSYKKDKIRVKKKRKRLGKDD